MKKKVFFALLVSMSISVDAACSIDIPSINFGSYNPQSNADSLSSSSFSLNCTNDMVGSSFSIKLNSGQSNSALNRYLLNNNEKLYYNLFLNSGRTTIWADGLNGTSIFNGIISNTVSIPVFSSIYKKQIVSPGLYVDNITYEITF